VPAAASGGDLRTQVSSMAQVIGSFANTAAQPVSVIPQLTPTTNGSAGISPAGLTVTSMAEVMKQFDAKGNLIAGPATTVSAAATQSLTGNGQQNPNSSGFLAVGGKA
jgi:trimeric autotransporter adhesin